MTRTWGVGDAMEMEKVGTLASPFGGLAEVAERLNGGLIKERE